MGRLTLSDGSSWAFASRKGGGRLVPGLLGALGLRPARPHEEDGLDGEVLEFEEARVVRLYRRNGTGGTTLRVETAPSGDPLLGLARVVRHLRSPSVTLYLPRDSPTHHMDLQTYYRAMAVIAFAAQGRGGALLHGALAEHHGRGIVLAGPGGVGKTTASGRLPPPWQSLSDDATLVVQNVEGRFLAHPWPTWSHLASGEHDDLTWDVARAVPLAGIFFMEQAREDEVTLIGGAEATGRLLEAIEQALHLRDTDPPDPLRRTIRLERLDNAVRIARSIPCHRLALSRNGAFWQLLERCTEEVTA